MSKVRVGHEDVFSAHVIDADNITEKYRFNFNHKWIVNNSVTKRISVRKIKVHTMKLTTEIGFAIDDANGTRQQLNFH
jgi:phage gp46-like protein